MLTTVDLIDLAKRRTAARMGVASITDYRLAKVLGISPNMIATWRARKSHISSPLVPRFAEACELDAAYVFACVESERAKDPDVLALLYRIAEKFSTAAAVLLVCIAIMSAPDMAHADPLYIMRSVLAVSVLAGAAEYARHAQK